MHPLRRRQAILKALTDGQMATVADLTAALGVSEATVRRDIREMADAKMLRKIHGGAELIADPLPPGSLTTQTFKSSETINSDQKRAIARAAVEICKDGESVMINGGSTTQKMTDYLVERRVNVLTNSIAVAMPLIERGSARVILAGGEVYRDHNIILSPFDHDSFENYLAAKAFIGAMCVGPHGAMEGDPRLVRTAQRMIRQVEEIVLLVDSSKFRRGGGMIVCPLDRISRIITDDGVDEATLALFDQAGVPVTVVTP